MKNIVLTDLLKSNGAVIVMPEEPFPTGYRGIAHIERFGRNSGLMIAVPEEKTKLGFEFIQQLSIEAGKCLAEAFNDQPGAQIRDMTGW